MLNLIRWGSRLAPDAERSLICEFGGGGKRAGGPLGGVEC